ERQRPVDELVRPEPPSVSRVVVEERLPAHTLVSAGDDDARLVEEQLVRTRDDRLEPGRAEAVDVHRGRTRRYPGLERAAPRVEGVGADLPDLAHHHLVDLGGLDTATLERGGDRG